MGGGSHHPPGSRRISTGGADTAPGSQESEPDSEERRVQILEARLPRVQHIDLCERSKTAAQEEIEDLRKGGQRLSDPLQQTAADIIRSSQADQAV